MLGVSSAAVQQVNFTKAPTVSFARVAYANGNTSNMLAYLWRHHTSVSTDSERKRKSGRKEQLLIPKAFKQHCNKCRH